jgi:hypothetical protein
MDGVQLRDEAGQDRVRAAVEFLDPSDARARRSVIHKYPPLLKHDGSDERIATEPILC